MLNKTIIMTAGKTVYNAAKQYGPVVATVVMGGVNAYAEYKFKRKVDCLEKTVAELQKK